MTENELPQDLLDHYRERCEMDGASFEEFIDSVRVKWSSAQLLLLVDKVEADVASNIGLMAEANPEIVDMAEQRLVQNGERMQRVRDGLRG